MSSDVTQDAPSPAQPAQRLSAGALLRELRSKQGLHIGAMAAMLKVPQAKLEALESDRLADLPDATFVRALAKAMCRVLKVDAGPVLELLPKGNEPELMVSRGLNQPYREHDARSDGLSLAVLQRPLVWGAALLLLGAAAIYLAPEGWVDEIGQAQPKASEPVAAVPAMSATAASGAALAEPILIESTLAASVPLQVQQAPASAPQAVQVAPAKASAEATAAVAGSVPLLVKTSADSWVEIIDSRGQVLLSRTLRAGEEQALTGVPPLKVKVGNVGGTEMLLRGSKVDLSTQAQSNVARLELN